MQYVFQVSIFHVFYNGKVLHLLAIARAADVPLIIDDFQEVSNRTPYIADLKYKFGYVCKVSRTDRDLGLLESITWKMSIRSAEFRPC